MDENHITVVQIKKNISNVGGYVLKYTKETHLANFFFPPKTQQWYPHWQCCMSCILSRWKTKGKITKTELDEISPTIHIMIICPPLTHTKEYIFLYTLNLYSKVWLSAPPQGWNLLTPNIAIRIFKEKSLEVGCSIASRSGKLCFVVCFG